MTETKKRVVPAIMRAANVMDQPSGNLLATLYNSPKTKQDNRNKLEKSVELAQKRSKDEEKVLSGIRESSAAAYQKYLRNKDKSMGSNRSATSKR